LPKLGEIPEGLDLTKLVFTVAERRNSSVQLKDPPSGRLSKPVFIDCSHSRSIALIGEMLCKKRIGTTDKFDYVRQPIRYIPNAPTIMVNDYIDAYGNEKPGLNTLGYTPDTLKELSNKAVAENKAKLGKDGYLHMSKLNDALLAEYLYYNIFNLSAPNQLTTKPSTMALCYKIYEREKAVQAEVVNVLDKAAAMSYVSSLGKRTASGGNTYDEVKIGALARIMGIDGQYPVVEDRFMALMRLVDANYNTFMKMKDSTINETKIFLGQAVQHNMLNVNANAASLTINKKPEVIVTFSESVKSITLLVPLLITIIY